MITTIILARLLDVRDFGLLGMVVAVTGVAELLRDSGLSAATVQAKALMPRQANAMAHASALLGFIFFIALVLAAPALASFYGRPEVRELSWALSPVFLLAGASAQHQAQLARRLQFAIIARNDLIATVGAACLSVTGAAAGMGYWSLALFYGGQHSLRAILHWSSFPWFPGKPGRLRDSSQLMKFGVRAFGYQLLNYSTRSADNAVIGRQLGATALGYYAQAYSLFVLPLNLVAGPVQRVAVPVLSRLQDEEERFRDYFTLAILLLPLVLWPAYAAISLLATEIVTVLLGPRWVQAGPYLALLSLAGLPQVLNYPCTWLFLATGRAKAQLRLGLLTRPLLLISFVVGIPWGVKGLIISYAVATYIVVPVEVAVASRGTALRVADWLKPLLQSAFATGGFAISLALTKYILVAQGAGVLLTVAASTAAGLATLGLISIASANIRLQLRRCLVAVRRR